MKLTINLPEGVQEFEFEDSGMEALSELESASDVDDIYEGIQLFEDAGLEATRQCRKFELGRVSGVPEFKTVMERQCRRILGQQVCVRVPVLYRRTAKFMLDASVCVSAPTSGDAWNIVRSCALTSLGVSIAVAIEAPAAAVPVAKLTMVNCLKAKGLAALADTVELGLSTRKESGEWRRSS
jgi:hypothetical protein